MFVIVFGKKIRRIVFRAFGGLGGADHHTLCFFSSSTILLWAFSAARNLSQISLKQSKSVRPQ